MDSHNICMELYYLILYNRIIDILNILFLPKELAFFCYTAHLWTVTATEEYPL